MSDDDGEGAIPPEGKFPQESGRVDAPQYSEPEEPDPHDLGPPIPQAPDPTVTDAEIEPAVHALFWWLVLVFNGALLALSLGVMIAVFDGKYELGAQIFAIGAVLFGYGYLRYRRFEREKDEDDADGGAGETTPREDEAGSDTGETVDGEADAGEMVDGVEDAEGDVGETVDGEADRDDEANDPGPDPTEDGSDRKG